jgi:hypothetical protein
VAALRGRPPTGWTNPPVWRWTLAGNIYVADRNNHRVQKWTPDGSVTTVAGGNGQGSEPSKLNSPFGVALDTVSNSIIVSDPGNNRVQKWALTATEGYTLSGFFAPVDMPETVNTVTAGRTVPLKFEVFDGSTELTDPAVVASFVVSPTSCSNFGAAEVDEVEFTTTGATSLRYDTTAGHFVQRGVSR